MAEQAAIKFRDKVRMQADFSLLDGSKPMNVGMVNQPAGDYRLVEVPNPYGYCAPWLMIEGTTIGMARGCWFDWPGVVEISRIAEDKEK